MTKSSSNNDEGISGAFPATDNGCQATAPGVVHSGGNSDSTDASAQHSPSQRNKIGRQTKSWTARGIAWTGVLIAVIGLLFGNNLIFRLFQSEPNIEQQFYATYSFKKGPFVHPKIIGDLIGWVGDQGDQVVSINLLDSQNSNRYFGEVSRALQTDTSRVAWPWIYSAKRELTFGVSPSEYWGTPFDAYRYLGSTRSGLDVLHAKRSGGGAGVSDHLVFVRIESDSAVDYPLLSDVESSHVGTVEPEVRNRELIKLVGKILLGDRWYGTVEIVGNDVVVRGRDMAERCRYGGVTVMEAVEMITLMNVVCKEDEANQLPSARVYRAPRRS